MDKVIGLMPVGGRGTRLGLPFPKPLAPTFTDEGIVPLYRHSLRHLDAVCENVVAIVNRETDPCLLRALDTDDVELTYSEEESLAAALRDAADAIEMVHPGAWIVTVLPDSIYRLDEGLSFKDLLSARRRDGALALFRATSDELDTVEVAGEKVLSVVTKRPGEARMVAGWAAFVIRAEAMAGFNTHEKDGPQLGRLDMGWVMLGSSVDLGTPERYMEHMDLRPWGEYESARARLADDLDNLIALARAGAGVSAAVEALADVRARRSTFATAEAFDSAMLEAAWNILAARSAGSGSRVEAKCAGCEEAEDHPSHRTEYRALDFHRFVPIDEGDDR